MWNLSATRPLVQGRGRDSEFSRCVLHVNQIVDHSHLFQLRAIDACNAVKTPVTLSRRWTREQGEQLREFFPMDSQGLSARERLSGWCEKYEAALGRRLIAEAVHFAEGCYLAFEIYVGESDEYVPTGVPQEAVISATRFVGRLPVGRPKEARPAEHAAHWLRSQGIDNVAVADYLRALHPWPSLDDHEIKKRLRDCEKRVNDAARVAAAALLATASDTALKEQIQMARELATDYPGHISLTEVSAMLNRRADIAAQIRAGRFDKHPPIVVIRMRHVLGRDFAVGESESLTLSWGRNALGQAKADAAALVSLPGWYSYWVNGPIDERL
jgi:hypothetical protein